MKRLLQTLIVTTTFFSLVSCDKNNNLVHHTVDNPVSAEIDGTLFQSAPEKILNYGGNVHQLIESDDEFVLSQLGESVQMKDHILSVLN